MVRLFLAMVVVLATGAALAADTLRVPGDFKTIQAAVDAAKPGDTVVVAPGTYRERVRLKSRVVLRSDGDDAQGTLGLKRAEATIIDGGGEAGEGPGVAMAEGSTLDGFSVTNVGLYDDASWKKHHATQGEQQSYEHIGEPGTTGIGIVGVTCIVRHNIVHHNGNSGIGIVGVPGKRCEPLLIHNICHRNMGGGIGAMKDSRATIRENVCFENFYAGIGHSAASPLVLGNVCYGNVRAGIGISEGASPIVRGNKCYKNRRAGIGIRTGADTRPTVEANDCYDNGMAGIGTRQDAMPVIRGNRCYRNKLAGIGSRTGASPTIIGNECFENEMTGIGQRGGTTTMLIGNYCHHNKTSGIGFEAGQGGRSTVLNNRVIDNAKVAVGINAGWSVVLSHNELSRKGGLPPIVMVFEGAEATFTENVIRGSGVAGIRAAGTVRAVGNQFEGEALRKVGPPNFGVWALAGSSVTLTENRFSKLRHALHAQGAEVSASGNRISEFHRAALVIKQPTKPALVFGNRAVAGDAQGDVVSVEGDQGGVFDNRLVELDDLEK